MNDIFRFSEATTIALHCAAAMAQQPERVVNARELADEFPVSINHLAKVMQRLARAGLVRSTRGPNGGFHLARPPETVSLLDVCEAVEGPLPPATCLFSRPACNGDCCLFGSTLTESIAAVHRRLRETMLSDLRGLLRFTSSEPTEASVDDNESIPDGREETAPPTSVFDDARESSPFVTSGE